MRAAIRHLLLLCLVAGVTACDPALTWQDRETLYRIRAHTNPEKEALRNQLVHGNPENLAKEEAKNHDYRLASLSLDCTAPERNVATFGFKCSRSVATRGIAGGCEPPPVFSKLVYRYNAALLRQPGFPHPESCTADPETTDWMREQEKQYAKAIQDADSEAIRMRQERDRAEKNYSE